MVAKGEALEGGYVRTLNYPDPAGQNVNSLPFGYSRGEGNYQFDTSAPSTPTITSPSHTSTTIVLNWGKSTDNVGVDHYDIYVGSSKAGSTTNTTATLNGLTTATAYGLKIKAVDKHGNESAFSNTLVVTTS